MRILSGGQEVLGSFQLLGDDVPFTLDVLRNEEKRSFTCKKVLIDKVEHHILKVNPEASPQQIALREAWSRTL